MTKIISANQIATMAGTNERRLSRMVRRGLIAPDFASETDSFYLPERVEEIRLLIQKINQQQNQIP